MPEEAYVGLFLSSHNPEVKETAIFRNVRVIKPVKVGFQPYRDYIGSRLEAAERHQRTSHADLHVARAFRSAQLAARWLRADLQRQRRRPGHARTAVEVRSGYAHADADRHRFRDPQQQRPRAVVRWHAARHQRSEHRQAASRPSSRCRRAAACPCASRRIRRSYMHGWTPDAKWLIYTGGRMPKERRTTRRKTSTTSTRSRRDGIGKEINLTNSPGLDDGPELSPDGKWIYFNSTRSGQMQIWRMTARRQEPGARDQRSQVERLVPALLARRQVDHDHLVRAGRRAV